MSDENQKEEKKIEYKKNVFDNDKLHLRVKNSSGKFAKFSFSVFRNNPRFTVFTGEQSDITPEDPYGRINAAMDILSLRAFIEYIKKAATSRDPVEFKLLCKRPVRNEAGEITSIEGGTEAVVGKDSTGMTYIAIREEGRSFIKFPFQFSDFHAIVKSDGTPLSEQEASSLVAMSYANLLVEILPLVAYHEYHEYTTEDKRQANKRAYPPKPRPANGQQRQGNWNRGGQGDNQASGQQRQGNYGYNPKPYNKSQDNYQQNNKNEQKRQDTFDEDAFSEF